ATYPGYKFDGSTADAKYVVRADGTGWFYVTKGLDGSIVSAWSSAVPTTTIEYAMSEGGLVAITDGAYTGASIDVPSDVFLVADPGVTGIKYASIADGARIDEPNFNAAFGRYSGGSYTVVTNQSSVATTVTWYLTFKPDNSIYFASTNASYVINSAFASLTPGRTSMEKVIVTGNITITAPLTIPRYTTLSGENNCKITKGFNGDMIKEYATATADSIIIENLELDGNYASYTGSGIVWTLTGTAGGTKDLIIQNCKIWYTYAHGINIELGGAGGTLAPKLYDNNVYTMDVGATGKKGLQMKSAADFHVDGGHYGVDTGVGAIYLEGCGAGTIQGIRTDGTVDLYVCREVTVGNVFVDLGNVHRHGMELYDVYMSQFSNIKIRTTGSNAWTDKSAIYLGKDSTAPYASYNSFSNIYAGRIWNEANTDRFAYAITEGNADCDNNQYVNINGHDCVTGALYLLGATSKGQHQNIIGNVTEA
ncbi:MAG: hypothetical protein PHH61_06440, partial [Candidatus Nanoarchaeia archaeon]|nr:hypothetical protein [Candidatus Nanoarchaeia archaeon]